MQEFEPILANGTSFNVVVIATNNKNSYASVRDGTVLIRIPRWLDSGEACKVANSMYLRMKKDIESRPNRYIDRVLTFRDGQTINVMDSEFCIHIKEDKRRNGAGYLRGSDIHISLPESLPPDKRERLISSIARRAVYKSIRGRLVEYVESINRLHFNSAISDVKMHGGASRWGSCRPDGVISLSFNLLFMPQGCLEYVVAHELAHTKVRGHTKRFWSLVGSVIPDYKERRRLLNDGGEVNPNGQGARL
jgi:hypothetical protein